MWVPALLVGCTLRPQDPRDPNDSVPADAVAGEAHLEKNSDGTISGVVTGLVVQGHDDEPLVEVDELELLAVGEGER